MVEVRRSVKQKVVVGAAVAALLAGGSIAAVSATGQSNRARAPRQGATTALHRGHARDLAAAAAYLGISPAQLTGELSSGKTLAQIADASAGKSAAGLTEALVAARKARLAQRQPPSSPSGLRPRSAGPAARPAPGSARPATVRPAPRGWTRCSPYPQPAAPSPPATSAWRPRG